MEEQEGEEDKKKRKKKKKRGRSLKDFSSLSQEATETWLSMTFTPHLLQYLCLFFIFALKFAPCLGMKLGVVFV
jgi:hypothetical protein